MFVIEPYVSEKGLMLISIITLISKLNFSNLVGVSSPGGYHFFLSYATFNVFFASGVS